MIKIGLYIGSSFHRFDFCFRLLKGHGRVVQVLQSSRRQTGEQLCLWQRIQEQGLCSPGI